MGMRNLEVVITVVDKASKQLDNVNRKVKDTGKAARNSNVDFTKFNRTLFSTGAFVATFVKAFGSLSSSLERGAELEKLSNQFERVLGPKGKVFDAIKATTDNSVDQMETMRQGIALANLGIIQSGGQLANIVAKAATAAKMAGKSSVEGIKAFSEFAQSGETSSLQFLNLIAKTNPALQAQMAILQKAGGVMGTVVSTQARLALGQALLDAATKRNLKGYRDWSDAVADISQYFNKFKMEIGRLLLHALGPFIEKLSTLFDKLATGIDYIRQNEKNLMFLIKTFVIGTGVILAFTAALGTFRLMILALTSIGFGLPKLIFSVLLLGSTFLAVTKKADGLLNKLKVFGAFIKGIIQLITSFDEETGESKIDESIKKLLQDSGIYDIAKNIARAALVIKRIFLDIYAGFKTFSNWLDSIFGNMANTIINFIGGSKKRWDRWWISDAIHPIEKFVRAATVLLGGFFAWVGMKAIFGNLLGGVLSKVPIIGRLFSGKGPKGTINDPLYTRDSDRIIKAVSKFTPSVLADRLSGGLLIGLKRIINDVIGIFSLINTYGLGSVIKNFSGAFFNVAQKFIVWAALIPVGIGALKGFFASLGDMAIFAQGIWDVVKALYHVTAKFLKLDGAVNYVVEGFSWIGMAFDWIYKKLEKWGFDIVRTLGMVEGVLGEKMSNWARSFAPEAFKEEKNSKGEIIKKQPELIITSATGALPSSLSENKTSTNPLLTIPKSQLEALDTIGISMSKVQSSEAYNQQLNIKKAFDNGTTPAEMLTERQLTAAFVNALAESTNIIKMAEALGNKTLQSNPLSSRESSTNYP